MKERLIKLLPHRDPMILLSGCDDSELSAGKMRAWVDISEDDLFFDYERRGVPAYVALEYMAQTMAAQVGAVANMKGEPVRYGMVLGTRSLDLKIALFEEARRYTIECSNNFAADGFASFNCAIYDDAGLEVANAVISAYQPDSTGMAEGSLKV